MAKLRVVRVKKSWSVWGRRRSYGFGRFIKLRFANVNVMKMEKREAKVVLIWKWRIWWESCRWWVGKDDVDDKDECYGNGSESCVELTWYDRSRVSDELGKMIIAKMKDGKMEAKVALSWRWRIWYKSSRWWGRKRRQWQRWMLWIRKMMQKENYTKMRSCAKLKEKNVMRVV